MKTKDKRTAELSKNDTHVYKIEISNESLFINIQFMKMVVNLKNFNLFIQFKKHISLTTLQVFVRFHPQNEILSRAAHLKIGMY